MVPDGQRRDVGKLEKKCSCKWKGIRKEGNERQKRARLQTEREREAMKVEDKGR